MHVAQNRFKPAPGRRWNIGYGLNRCREEWFDLGELAQFDPFRPFGEDEKALVRHLDHFVDGRKSANGVQIAGLRAVDTGVPLGDNHNCLFLAK